MRIKWGLMAVAVHLILAGIPDLFRNIDASKIETLNALLGIIQFLYEWPMGILFYILNVSLQNINFKYLFVNYIIGCVFYFCLGISIYWLFGDKKKK